MKASRLSLLRSAPLRFLPALCLAGLCLAGLTLACGGPQVDTESTLLAWAGAIKNHLTLDHDANWEVPDTLMSIKPEFRDGMPEPVDGWGRDLHYRKWVDDHYDLISAGPDGEFGNDDDIILTNGLLKKPVDVYGERPFRR